MQLLDVQAIEVIAPLLQVGIVGFPGGDGVFRNPGCIQDGLPQLFHCGGGAHSGEHLLGPGLSGDGGNAPLLLVFQLILIGLENGVAHSLCLGQLFHIDALQAVGVFGNQVNPGGHGIHIVLLPGLLPLLHRAQRGNAAVTGVDFGQRLIVPLHAYLLGLGLIGLLHHQLDKLRLIQVCIDKNLLPLLDIHAAFYDQAGIFPQNSFFHGFTPFILL